MERRTLLKTASVAALASVTGLPVRAAGEPLKVGFVYVGPINDGGWTQHHHHSAEEMVHHFGDKVELS